MILFSFLVFLSAFLLFQLEFIVGKLFLPNYGGSYIVWGGCMVFFQAALLLGYVYAHLAVKKIGFVKYRALHLLLMAVVFFVFPGRALDLSFSSTSLPLTLDIFLRLCVTIGPVFFVLSTMSSVAQVWLASSRLPQKNHVYALYAMSNFGSLAALISYPFVVELLMGVSQQLMIWRIGYAVLFVLAVIVFFTIPVEKSQDLQESPLEPMDRTVSVRWFLLSMAGVMMFLSVNNLITNDMPPVPLFWIWPMGVYLITFILNFQKKAWYPSWISSQIILIIWLAAAIFFLTQLNFFPPVLTLVILLLILFLLCMYCHRGLIDSKPKDARHLTFFYFVIALGGCIGGMITTWIIPMVSTLMLEYLIALVLIAVSIDGQVQEPKMTWASACLNIFWIIFFGLWPLYFRDYHLFGLVILFGLLFLYVRELPKTRYGLILGLALLVAFSQTLVVNWDGSRAGLNYRLRNYYGIYKVCDFSYYIRNFYHGTTLHGAQSLNPATHLEPTTYYSRTSPIGEVMMSSQFALHNIGLVGLGIGVLTTYLSENQNMDVYELDPDVYKISIEKFDFLNETKGKLKFFFGDARLSLKQNPTRVYDALIVDAFGGDSVPTHLLTREMILEYRRHLNSDGVILIHLSNRYINLMPVVGKTAESTGADIVMKATDAQGAFGQPSLWAAITWDSKVREKFLTQLQWKVVSPSAYAHLRVWTDDASSILPVLKIGYLWESLKKFNFFKW